MNKQVHLAITISREIGSGGSFLGQRVSKAMGLAYLDRDIVEQTARTLSIAPEEVAQREEEVATRWEEIVGTLGYALAMHTFRTPPVVPVADRKLHEVEAQVIRALVNKQDCVVVGRGAGRLLQDHPCILRVFLHAPRSFRVRRVAEVYGLTDPREAEALVARVDAERPHAYRTMFNEDWADARNYDLSLNVARVGFELAERMIIDAARQRKAAAC